MIAQASSREFDGFSVFAIVINGSLGSTCSIDKSGKIVVSILTGRTIEKNG